MNDHAIREKFPDSSMYGSADRPSNTTSRNGEAGSGGGGTGCTLAAIFTDTVRDLRPASGSASRTSTDHSSSPVSLSTCWTLLSLVDFSKSNTGPTSLIRYAPNGNTSSCVILNRRAIAICLPPS